MDVTKFIGGCFAGIVLLTTGAATAGDPTLVVDRPRDGDMLSGIVDFRGWALSTDAVEFIEVFVDDVSFGRMGYGGSRNDVSGAFPGFPDSANPGFAGAFNLGRLDPGDHVVRIVAHDSAGHMTTVTRNIMTFRFGDRDYLRSRLAPGEVPEPGRSHIGLEDFALLGIDVSYLNILIDTFNVYFSWNEQIQNFEITRIFDEQTAVGPYAVVAASDLEAVVDGADVALQWVSSSTEEFPNDGVYIERRFTSGFGINPPGPWKRIAIVAGNATNYIDSTVFLVSNFPGKYEYRVISFTTENQSDPSNVETIVQTEFPLLQI